MDYMIFTHSISEKRVRRFLVSKTERNLYRKVEREISNLVSRRIFEGSWHSLCLHDLYTYVENRWYTFHPADFKDFVDHTRFLYHMKDYCDVVYSRVFGRLAGYSERMRKYSEILPVNKEA